MLSSHERSLDFAARPASGDPAFLAFQLLRATFVLLPIIVGIDKFFDHFTDWTQYLWVGIPNALHVSAATFMHGAGVVEIIAGLVVLFAPEIGGAIVAAWLAGIIVNLLVVAHDVHEYWDIALRDGALLVAAISLALLASRYRPFRLHDHVARSDG